MGMLEVLLTWWPFMFEGFGRNVAIASLAMAIGTLLGGALAFLHLSTLPGVALLAGWITNFFRNVPTLILLFYLSTLLPNEWDLAGGQVTIPIAPWVKAAVALAASPIGFTAWNLHAAILAWRQGEYRAAALFMPNWLSSFLITLLASSVASLVGADELLSRCNTIIKATGDTQMVAIYLFASLHFLLFCLVVHHLVQRLKHAMLERYPKS
jgi:polar amino acid transport system permease protein